MKMNHWTMGIAAMAMAMMTLTACGKDKAAGEHAGHDKAAAAKPGAAAKTAAAKPGAAEAKGGGQATAARTALEGYEGVRKGLAADDYAATKAAAAKLAAGGSALAASAKTIAAAAELEAARAAFGPLAKAALTLAKAHPSAVKGGQAYLCPMAKGYQKWLQLDADMANPYMGKRMLKCGTKEAMTP